MRFVNLTPHDVKIHNPDGETVVVPRSGRVARCDQVANHLTAFLGVEVKRVTCGRVNDLPAREHGVVYIVSTLVRTAEPDRPDLASPGGLVRDTNGNVVGCEYLVVN